MSQDGVYLDAATCFRLVERAAGKPIPKRAAATRVPIMPALNQSPEVNALRLAQYEKAVENAAAKEARNDRHHAEFANLEFVWACVIIPGSPIYDEERIMARMEYKGDHVMADVVTGTLYRESDGTCLSSTQIRIVGPTWPSTQEDRTTYLNTRGEEKVMGTMAVEE